MSNPFSKIKSGFDDEHEMRAPIIKPEEIVFGKLIATGAFGEVYGGTCRGKSVALKRLPAPEDEEEIEQILNEMEIVINVRHPNVVLFMGVCIELTGDIVIVQELMDCDLFAYLRKNPQITLVEKLFIVTQIAVGMTWLHGGDPIILHSDLKPENVLMDSQGNAKICDFGLSSVTRATHIERDGIIGTPLYMGPEALMEESIGKAADVYSFAVVAWAIFNVQEPFSHIQDYDELVDAVVYRNERPPLRDLEKISPELVALMNRMWAPDANKRPTFPDIVASLQELLVKIALPGYDAAQAFWARFNGELDIPFNAFKEELCLFLDVSQGFYKTAFMCFAEVAGCKNGENVKLVKFAQVIDWFGDLSHDSNGDNILDRIVDVFKCQWFYGPISSKAANAKLKSYKKGTFLVRVNTGSNSREEPFRISAVGKSAIHYCVKNKVSVFEITIKRSGKKSEKIQSRPNIKEMIDVAKKVLKLKNPCPGRDYNEFFEDNSVLYAYTSDMPSSDSF